ncbi:hydroxypyruvate isomerase family protein [Aneurinibacillus danicus]|jgi:hydroxypyruvate isomerase|uniref:Hydroxypyruvate isomerase n=1 Tax=Aneurinibacillus danicus TaxID=267746 RepID=A0A511V3P1_9BACL|nr:TIM barrel protein [Aneurinibacillus danicus]GEN33535.1 hydroxypyruvate isomerase [Aneurinibacillus danicus]
MLRFSANITTLYPDVPFLERFGKARAAGFRYVECQFPYAHSIADLQAQLQEHELELVLFNLPPGDWQRGERGLAIDPKRREDFKESVTTALRYATELGCSRLHCMAGILPDGLEHGEAYAVLHDNVAYAVAEAAQYGITILIEPINQIDMPGYYMSSLTLAERFIREFDSPHVRLQFDFYHIQRMQGELLNSYSKVAPLVEHVQIADHPGRHQPGTGEIDYVKIFEMLEATGYNGFIGCEYTPFGDTDDSLHWLWKWQKGEEK